MAVIIPSSLLCFFLHVLITCQEVTLTKGRFLSSVDKYNLENTQQGHSPGVGHPFIPSEDATKHKEQPHMEGKTHDYSPGFGHLVPTSTDGYTKPEAAGGRGTSAVANKRNAGGKPIDYSPGVGHSVPGSDEHAATVAWKNKDGRRDEQLENEGLLAIDSHSPGVGHSIQKKHAEPRARK